MSADRGLRLWLAAIAVLSAALLAALLVATLVPDPNPPIRDDGFADALEESQAQEANARATSVSWATIAALGLATGAPLGLAIGGVILFRRYRASLAEGR